MSKGKIRQKSYKYFTLLFLGFALLITTFFLPLFLKVYNMTREQVLASTQRRLDSGSKSCDTMHTSMVSTYLSAVSSADFRSLLGIDTSHQISPILLRKLSESLYLPFVSHDAIRDVGIIYSENVAITRRRTFFSDTFTLYPTFLSCEDEDFDDWYAQLASAPSSGAWIPARAYTSSDHGTYTALTYVRTWQSARPSSGLAPVYYVTIDCEALTDLLLLDREILEDGYFTITDQYGNLLYSAGVVPEHPKGYSVLSSSLSGSQFHIEVGVSDRYIFKQIQDLSMLLIWYPLLLFFGITALAVIFSRETSRPLRGIVNSIHELGISENSPQGTGSLKSDYTVVSSSLMNMNQELMQNAFLINEQKNQLRTYLFSKAINGGLYSQEEISRFTSLFPDFPKEYRLIRILVDQENSGDETDPFLTVLETAGSLGISLTFFHYIGYSTMIWLIADGSVSKEDLEHVSESVSTPFAHYSFTISPCYGSMADLPVAYQQLQFYGITAGAAHEVRIIDDDTFSSTSYTPANYSAFHDMYNALSTGKDAQACAILLEISDMLFAKNSDASTLQHVYTMLYDMIVQLKLEHPEKLGKVRLPLYDDTKAEQLFTKKFPEYFRRIGSLLREQIGAVDVDAQLIAFLNQHLFSPEMCLSFVCDELRLQKSTVQDAMKRLTGMTFFSYVEEKRLKRACTLLQKGLPVQEVSASCGFASPNSFYKAFKRKFGVAPSAYAETLDDGPPMDE